MPSKFAGALALAFALLFTPSAGRANSALLPSSLRAQADMEQQWLAARLEQNLPALMRKHGVAMWIVACREYAEDPAFFALVSPTVFAARRTTIYVFNDLGPEKGVERLALGGDSNGGLYQVYRDPDAPTHEIYGPSQWQLLRKLVDSRNPRNIAIDISATHAFSDGLTVGMQRQLLEALGSENAKKFVNSELLALEYQDLRVPAMLPTYREMMTSVHAIIAEAFSNKVITPGKTTNTDVVWWMRQKVNDLGYGTWFQTSVTVQRPGSTEGTENLKKDEGTVIQRGDVLHTDIVLRNLRPGRTGNEILATSLDEMKTIGIKGTIYTHPIGDHGHAAGPLIGLWDRQQGVPGRGDVPLLANTWFSIELSATTAVPEWKGQEVQMGLEEDAAVDAEGKASWVAPRQTEFHLVR